MSALKMLSAFAAAAVLSAASATSEGYTFIVDPGNEIYSVSCGVSEGTDLILRDRMSAAASGAVEVRHRTSLAADGIDLRTDVKIYGFMVILK